MSSFEVSTEEARVFITKRHSDQLEVPRTFNFNYVGNHLAAAVVFAAMGEPEQMHDIEKLYVAFRGISPPFRDTYSPSSPNGKKTLTRGQARARAASHFTRLKDPVIERVVTGTSPDILDAIDYELAAAWQLDEAPVYIFATDSQGTTVQVSNMGGFLNPDDGSKWDNVCAGIQSGIAREFDT